MIIIPKMKYWGISSSIVRTFQRWKLMPAPSECLTQVRCSDVLRTRKEYEESVRKLDYLGLPRHIDKPKNWDSLAAISVILKYCPDKSARILDAGGEYYSSILSQLEYCGYMDLTCINLTFYEIGESLKKKGNITFAFGDIVATEYPNDHFEAITCQSVIEHGVDINHYFREMSRILKPGGILFTSTDYWEDPIDTTGKQAYGTTIRIFNGRDIQKLVVAARRYGFELVEPLDLKCKEKTVSWTEFDLDYTFIYFTFRKKR